MDLAVPWLCPLLRMAIAAHVEQRSNWFRCCLQIVSAWAQTLPPEPAAAAGSEADAAEGRDTHADAASSADQPPSDAAAQDNSRPEGARGGFRGQRGRRGGQRGGRGRQGSRDRSLRDATPQLPQQVPQHALYQGAECLVIWCSDQVSNIGRCMHGHA